MSPRAGKFFGPEPLAANTKIIIWVAVSLFLLVEAYLLFDMMYRHPVFEFEVQNDFDRTVSVTPLGQKKPGINCLLPLFDGDGPPFHRAVKLGDYQLDPKQKWRFILEAGKVKPSDILVKTADGKILDFPVRFDHPMGYYINNAEDRASIHVGPEENYLEAYPSQIRVVRNTLGYRAIASLLFIFMIPFSMLFGMLALAIKGRAILKEQARQKESEEKFSRGGPLEPP